MNLNTFNFGHVWTGKFELRTLNEDGNLFSSGKKKLRIQKYPDTCGRGLICFRDVAFQTARCINMHSMKNNKY